MRSDAIVIVGRVSSPEVLEPIRYTVAIEIAIAGLVEISKELHLPAVIHSIVIRIQQTKTNQLRNMPIRPG